MSKLDPNEERLRRMASNICVAQIVGAEKEAIKWAIREIERLRASNDDLAAALHAVKAHPNFAYIVIPSSRKTINFPAGGWETCPEATVAPGDECWRRRKDAT